MDESFNPVNALDKAELKRLVTRSNTKGTVQLASHLGALAVTGGLVWLSLGTVVLPLALLAHGFVLIFLFAPLHECVHRTAFRRRLWNDLAATFCGAVLLLPANYFRLFHFAHHRFTQDPAKDPELAAPKPTTIGGYLLVVSGLPYWRTQVGKILSHATGRVEEAFIPVRQQPTIVREARAHLAVYAVIAGVSIASSSPAALVYWALPVVLGQPFLRMFLLAEHGGCPLVADMLRNSRTTRSNAGGRWLAWNMPYHSAHHAYPALPFHALPAAHNRLKDRVTVTAPGYIAVQRELIRGLDA